MKPTISSTDKKSKLLNTDIYLVRWIEYIGSSCKYICWQTLNVWVLIK